jgi:hypothetical protein
MSRGAPQAEGVCFSYQRSAVLEPVMLAAVNLYELAGAIAAVAGLLDTLATLHTGLPNAIFDHPLAQRLDRHPKAVHLEELLVRQRRAEIRIPRPDDAQGLLTQPVGQDMIALATPAATENPAGDAGADTVFEYHQDGDFIWAR